MFSIQDSLPTLPVPPLDHTLNKYLKSIVPLVSPDEYKYTEKVVSEFQKHPGPILQKFLEERAAGTNNWLSEWWKHVAYLDFRAPVVVNSNPAVIFPKQNYQGTEGKLRFAARLVAGALQYKQGIDNQTIPVETLGGKPLCMSQYYKIMSACRIPGPKIDTHYCFTPGSINPPRHINVLHNNQIFSLDVYGKEGDVLNIDQIYEGLMSIVNQSQTPVPPVGIFGVQDRKTWSDVYNKLRKDKKNKSNFENINRSIFVLCLDGAMPQGKDEGEDKSISCKEMLYGGGSQYFSGNRWFDKTLQFIVGDDGRCGLNYEHTTAEGPAIAAIMDHVLAFIERYDKKDEGAGEVTPPVKLEFTLTNDILDDIEKAKDAADRFADDLDICTLTFKDYGKNFPKSVRMSPDAFIQMAFQLAYYRMYNEPCATYETASLRRFQEGRSDTIRSCSIESYNFTQAMDDSSVDNERKVELLRKAVQAHRDYTDQAITGKVIDRHLLGLKLAAIEKGLDVPKLHMDSSYNTSTYFKLSTSQVGARFDAVMCFGPVVPDGYGLCYNPQEKQLNFSISAYNNSPETSSIKYKNMLEKSLKDMQKIIPTPAKL
ncbi:hypothetical protein LOTGIDRAFT_137716 [Lottia gigantea]|uniref:Carnitine O-acetyltransferase n=1 Tax=Lottia gigantea TaxID=225164 RepID=V4AGR3_LOTGI|nr:hypothetical protein LOTGIDRAFT_137716 [Lottia gigantea]ESP03239.1 hypothetical protein LOTGIDRAFT_137716 [Lottia gigantea]